MTFVRVQDRFLYFIKCFGRLQYFQFRNEIKYHKEPVYLPICIFRSTFRILSYINIQQSCCFGRNISLLCFSGSTVTENTTLGNLPIS